jgi:hypothetical protein
MRPKVYAYLPGAATYGTKGSPFHIPHRMPKSIHLYGITHSVEALIQIASGFLIALTCKAPPLKPT